MVHGFNARDEWGDSREAYSEDMKALPELLIKQQIAVIKRDEMIRAYEDLVYNKKLNNGRLNANDKYRVEAKMIGMFMHIKDMITERTPCKRMTALEKGLYDRLMTLQLSEKTFDLKTTVDMMNYLLQKLNDLGLTNLLIRDGDPFQEIKDSLGLS